MAPPGNSPPTSPGTYAQLLGVALDGLRARLPDGWEVQATGPLVAPTKQRYDALLRLEGPDGSAALLALELRARPGGQPPQLAEGSLPKAAGRSAIPVLVSAYVPADLRATLRRQRIGYIDATGNLDIRVSRPTLFISAEGASRNPWPVARPARTLRSPKAARVVRVLADLPQPLGVRQVAALAGTDPGYASRIIRMLAEDGILQVRQRGPVTKVDRERLVQRWSTDYGLWTTNRVLKLFTPRDLSSLSLAIRNAARGQPFRYALTGPWIASKFAPISASRLLTCFVDDPEAIADRLGLRREEQIANVWLIAPFDPVVYERPQREQGVTIAAPAQVLVDTMTSPGRAPSEGEAYLAWLREHEELWRA